MPKSPKKTISESATHQESAAHKSAHKSQHLLHHKAPEERSFLLCTGAIVHSVKQLADELEHVDDSVYFYHTPGSRNDFAQWVQDVFADTALADRIRNCHSRDHLRATVYQYLLDSG